MMALRSQLDLNTARRAPVRPHVPAPGGQVIDRLPFGGSFAWTMDPYGGCEHGCAHCPSRLARSATAEAWLEQSQHAMPRTQGTAVLLAQLRDVAARQDKSFTERPVLLGAFTDPWQPAEREAGLTRSILEALVPLRGLDLRATTRSSLVGRDLDLLGQIARTGKVRVSVVLSALDRRSWLTLEPHAPSPDRRLMAIGLLARANIPVGVEVGPVLRGVNDSDDAWARLLARAREAGASFATARPLELSEPARERLVVLASEAEPERVATFKRLFARPHLHDARSWAEASQRFAAVCRRFELDYLEPDGAPRRASSGPARQLSLF